jgi:hypothetical protein
MLTKLVKVRQSTVADPDFGAVSGWFCERAAFVAGLLNVLWPRKMRKCTEVVVEQFAIRNLCTVHPISYNVSTEY